MARVRKHSQAPSAEAECEKQNASAEHRQIGIHPQADRIVAGMRTVAARSKTHGPGVSRIVLDVEACLAREKRLEQGHHEEYSSDAVADSREHEN